MRSVYQREDLWQMISPPTAVVTKTPTSGSKHSGKESKLEVESRVGKTIGEPSVALETLNTGRACVRVTPSTQSMVPKD